MARDLRLQVMLNAVDRVTGPLKRMRQGASQTGQAMRETQTQLRDLQRQQADLSSYRKANAALRQNTRAMRDARSRNQQYTQALDQQREAHAGIKSGLTVARREYDRLARQLLNTKQPNDQLNASLERARVRLHSQQTAFDRSARSMREYKNRARHAGEEVKRLTQNQKTQAERIRGLKTRLDEAGISTDNMGRSARELRTKEERLNAALQEQKRHLAEVAQRQRRLTQARDRYQNGMAGVSRAQGVGMGMLGTGMAQGYAASRLLAPGVAWGEQMSTLQAVGRFDADDERYQALRQQSRDLGGSTAFSATEVGGGQEFLLRAGMSSEAIKASMRDVLDLALANNTELSRAADIASNIAGAFKIDMEADGSMARVADILSGTASRANVDLEMLGETMKYLGGAEDLKLTMEQAAAMSGILGNIGIQGSQAGTTMRAMMNRLTNPAAKGATAIENIGLQVSDANGNMRAMPDILRDISQATADLGNVERKAIMQDIFGVEAGSGMAELVDAMGGGQLDEIINALGDNMGENARMAATMTDNIGGDLKALKSAWAEVGISITDTNDGPLRELIQSITTITRGVGDWIKANPELAGTIAKVVGGLIALATVGGAVTMTFASILSPLLFARFAMSTLGIQAGVLGPVLKTAGAALFTVGRALTVGLLGALKATAAFLVTNPIGWAILAIAATALVIYKYWEPIKGFFLGLWQRVKDAFNDGIGGVARLLADWSPLGLLYSGMSSALGLLGIELPGTLSEFGSNIISAYASGISRAWSSVKNAVSGITQRLKDAFGEGISGVSRLLLDWSPLGLLHTAFVSALDSLGIEIPDGFRSLGGFIVDGLIGGITGKLAALRERIVSIGTSIMNWFKGVLGIHSPSRVFAGFGMNIVEGIIGGISNMAGALRDQVMGLASDIAGWMSDAIGSALNTGREIAGSIGDGITNGARAVGNAARNAGNAALDTGRDVANGMADGIRSGTNAVKDAVGWLTGSTEDEARDNLDTHSPSRVFKSIGNDVAGGLRDGIAANANAPVEQVRSLTDRLRNAATGLMLSAGIASPALALDVQSPTLPTLPNIGAQQIQRPELPNLYTRIATPELPTLDALAFEWPELPQFDPLQIDTRGIQIDARSPLQNKPSEASSGLVINGGINIEINAAPGMNEQDLARLVNAEVQRALRDAERRAQASRRSAFHDID